MKRVLFSFLLILGMVFCFPANAITSLKRIYLDKPTLTGPGYTVTYKSFAFGIYGGLFHEGAWFVLKPFGGSPPDGWNYLRGPITYDVRVQNPTPLSGPIWIAFNMDGYQTTKRVSAGYYNYGQKRWVLIPTWRTSSGDYRTAIHFPYSPIALFEHKTEGVVPKQILPNPTLPDVAAGAVLDRRTGAVVWERNGDAVRSMASITKLMTALVVLDTHPNWDQVVIWNSEYERGGARLAIQPGERLTVRNLWFTTLLASANNATIALARSTGLSEQEFVARMNAKAKELHLEHTVFVEPTGLDPRNVSTAKEIVLLGAAAFRNLDVLIATTSRAYSFATSTGVRHYLRNTNDLLYSTLRITGSKTGYIDESGYNLVMQTIGPKSQELITVVLGTSSKASREASEEALIRWAYDAFQWP